MIMEEIKKNLIKNLGEVKGKKIAAVLVPIYIEDGIIKLFFEKRVEKLGRHSGEISFPGGEREDKETPIETALRETEEEIGIKKQDIETLGYLQPTKVKSSGFTIIPVVGYIKKKPEFKINKAEVEKVLVISIEEIEANRKKTILGEYYKVGEYVIWGATARILKQLIEIIENLNH